ncbi:MAG TPA: hypothetical protein VIM07_15805 [Chitinophagaceae bacterium]
MKKIFISFLAAIVLLAAVSCKKIVSALFQGMDVNVPEVQVTIPTVIAVTPNEVSLGSFSLHFNLDSIIKANTAGVFGVNSVSSIKVKQISITINNADQLNNLSNFERARITLQSNSDSNPAELFSINFPDSYASSFTYTPVNSPDLLPYLKGSDITYNIFGKMRRITTKPLNMTVAVTLRVT